ncbi:CoA pyrophosphatase [Piscinibacter gummiphilus]|uniref:CoA pyrophosphatase n=1 Tax=Piscinibacter gummiphilus TaxID=946333 RepID=A0ABZ0CWN5_9BURK|nr:CoA pyrophosphatase [Piscinibacter gummiphilus]WOB07556.1 CoA pyrophosphatase [Piscinibacter gummiphilus]
MNPPALPDLPRDDALRARIERHLRAFDVQAAPAGGTLPTAAVALAIVDEGLGADLRGLPKPAAWSTQAALLLTRRSAQLRRHAGQWALPGGRLDAGETPEQAALREMAEEVNLVLDERAVLGRLDDFVTRSGFVITPVVVWAGAARELVPNPHEVASVHRIAAAEFLRADAPLLDRIDESEHAVLRMPVGDDWIAAPTAALLYQFREVCLEGRATRVAHFEQPLFAWK